jgi:hypothetical protein
MHTHLHFFSIRHFLVISSIFLISAASTAPAQTDGIWQRFERQAPTKEIRGMFVLPDGRIAAGCEGSLHLYESPRWKKIVFDVSQLANHVPFFADSKGKLYFLDGNRLVVLDGDKITRYDSLELLVPVSSVETAGGSILFGSYSYDGAGIFSFDGVSFTKISDNRTRSITLDTSGGVWATLIPPDDTTLHLMYRNGGEWSDRTSEIEQILPVIGGNLLVQSSPDGSVWVTNEGSHAVYRDGSWSFTKFTGGNAPTAVAFDRSGRVWGYSTRKIYLLDNEGNWKVSRTTSSFLPNGPGFIKTGPDSSVYICDADTVFRWSGNAWAPIENPFDLGSDQVTCVAFLSDGRLVCGHALRGTPYEIREHRGLSIFDGVSWKNFTSDGGDFFRNVYVMKQSPNGEVVFYSDDGYYEYDGKSFYSLDSLRVFDTTDIEWDSGDRMWLTTDCGVIKYRNPDFDIYPPPEKWDPWGGVYNLCIDGNDTLFMQAIHGHILYTDQDTWYLKASDPGEMINDIAVESDGTLWASRVLDLSRWSDNEQEFQPVVSFSDSNRLVSIDPDLRIWASSYSKTGYLQNGEYCVIPDLAETASNVIAFSSDGRIALNAFDRDRATYMGVNVFLPKSLGVHESPRPEQFITARAFPNPFNPSTTIRFGIPTPGKVNITVYNVAGQKVRTLVNRPFSAGESSVVWDGRMDDGKSASSGVYLFRIVSGKLSHSDKLLLLK